MVIFWSSLFLLLIAVILGLFAPDKVGWKLAIIIIATISSAVLFPLSVGYFYDKYREKHEGNAVWRVFRELYGGGIMQIYRDREESESVLDAQTDLRQAFSNHTKGKIKMLGVTLRVFFQPLGPFNRNISNK